MCRTVAWLAEPRAVWCGVLDVFAICCALAEQEVNIVVEVEVWMEMQECAEIATVSLLACYRSASWELVQGFG